MLNIVARHLERSGGEAQAASTGSSVNPSRRAIGSIVNPWTRVETRTTKNAMLKNSILRGTFSITGKVARTTGTAPRNPAQPNRSRSVAVYGPNAVATAAASGLATRATTSASSVPLQRTTSSWLGNTSTPRAKNKPISASAANPSTNALTDEDPGSSVLPNSSPVRYAARKPDPCSPAAVP